jgi:thiol:disulfide interchange protein
MRYGYWWIQALLGALLIIAPFVEKFTEIRTATFTDVILGIVVVIWALVGYWSMAEMKPQGVRSTHA